MKPIWWLQVDIWREEEGLLRAGTGEGEEDGEDVKMENMKKMKKKDC